MCSAFIFNRLTDAVARYMKLKGYVCYNYLDDFIVIGKTYGETCTAKNFLIATLRKLGFSMSWKRLISPTQRCRYLGIDIDSVNKQLILPPEKMDKLHAELKFWYNKKTSTKLQMQRLCGVLNFCCKIVRGGRVYMFNMIKLLKLFNNRRRIELPPSFHEDLDWWLCFAKRFNGAADFFDPGINSVEIYTNACLYGLAAICGNDFYQAIIRASDDEFIDCYPLSNYTYAVNIPVDHVANINVLEIIAVWLALVRWKEQLRNCRVLCYCDNLQVCFNLAKDKTVNPLSNQCLRNIFWLCVDHNIYISPVYIPSKHNIDADYLSLCLL